ncbi:outer membrane beta-barrel protein [Aquimarina sp. 2201CG1-2-11]|uniref:outer membrane beta-barrel protein n=1 Tax=Aquimarina discodermiae TaxID=3231043 RepID=UPI0034633E31
MRKLLLTALAFASFATASAQDEKTAGFTNGDVFISGNVGFSSEKFGERKENSFTVAPRVGFFVSENIAIGGKLGFTSQKEELGSTEDKTNAFSVGAFGRYYFSPASKFSVFGEFGADYRSTNQDNGTTDVTNNGFGIGGGPGVSYFIGNNFALEAFWGALRYATEKADTDGAESQDNFDLNVNLEDITLGLVYKF